jgi:hypothetical protein
MSKRKYYSLLITLPACAEGRQVKLGAKWLLDLIFILSPYEYWLHFMQRSPIIKLISLYRNSPQKRETKGGGTEARRYNDIRSGWFTK